MKKILVIVLVAAALYFLYGVAHGFLEAAKHGGSPAARARRLVELAKQDNVGLPRTYGKETVMLAVKAGPGLRYTYVIQLVNANGTNVNVATLEANARKNILELYKTNPAAADFRKWEVEICWQMLDKDRNEITSVVVSPKDL